MFRSERTPNKIIDKLWLGDLSDAENTKRLQKLGVTHILTLNDWKLDAASSKNFKTMYIQIDDIPDENISGHFDKCFAFLDEARTEGGALVHCLMGMSRSATIVIGYLVGRGHFDSFELAFEHVRICRSCVQPNPGFLRQLRTYCDRVAKQRRSTKTASSSSASSSATAGTDRSAENSVVDGTVQGNAADTAKKRDNSDVNSVHQVYSCKACRARLFSQAALILHRIGERESDMQVTDSSAQTTDSNSSGVRGEDEEPVELCSGSLFVDPYAVDWLSKIVNGGSETNGKLHCVNMDCRAKIGSYSWIGETCSACGAWVTPAFQFHKQKLDSFSFAMDSRY